MNYRVASLLKIDYVPTLNEQTNQNSIKVPKVAKTTNKKTLGTSVINSQMSPPSLGFNLLIGERKFRQRSCKQRRGCVISKEKKTIIKSIFDCMFVCLKLKISVTTQTIRLCLTWI